MRVRDVTNRSVACCHPDANLVVVAALMGGGIAGLITNERGPIVKAVPTGE